MVTFSFGRNWKRYVKYILDEGILQNAQDSLVRYFGEDFDFTSKVFVDIGCGSGIFSLCALRLGCKKAISIDIDSCSIDATLMTRDRFGADFSEKWEVKRGSILDSKLVEELQNILRDENIIVYSWGVLHHTGDLQKAMDHVMTLMRAGGGQLCLYCPLQPNASQCLVA